MMRILRRDNVRGAGGEFIGYTVTQPGRSRAGRIEMSVCDSHSHCVNVVIKVQYLCGVLVSG